MPSKWYARNKEARLRFRAMGLCSKCGRTPVPGTTYCERCKQKAKEYNATKKATAKERGTCPHHITTPVEPGHAVCKSCVDKDNAEHRRRWDKRRTEIYTENDLKHVWAKAALFGAEHPQHTDKEFIQAYDALVVELELARLARKKTLRLKRQHSLEFERPVTPLT